MKAREHKKKQFDLSKRPGRKIVVNKVTWKYQVGSISYVVAYSETGERLASAGWDVLKITEAEWWRRKYKGNLAVTPIDIKAWILDETT